MSASYKSVNERKSDTSTYRIISRNSSLEEGVNFHDSGINRNTDDENNHNMYLLPWW